MQGISVVACAATRPENVEAAVKMGGTAHRTRIVDGIPDASAAIRRGELAALVGIDALCRIPEVDVVIDATAGPTPGRRWRWPPSARRSTW